MRRITYGEGWLGANMVIMVLEGVPLNPQELVGKVCGNSFTNGGEDFIVICPLKLVLVLPFSFSMIVGVRRVLYEMSSPSIYVLAVNKDFTITYYCQCGHVLSSFHPRCFCE